MNPVRRKCYVNKNEFDQDSDKECIIVDCMFFSCHVRV